MRFLNRAIARSLLLAVAGLSLLPASARAEDACGRFTLAATTYWNQETLPAGRYEYSVDYSGPAAVLTLRNLGVANGSYMFLPNSWSPADRAEGDRLELEQVDGKKFVSSVYVHSLEIVFHYPVPEAKAKASAAVPEERNVGTR